jgi:hypothetical protein
MTDVLDNPPPAHASPDEPPVTRYLCIAPAASGAGDFSAGAGLAHQHVRLCTAGQTIASVTASAEALAPQAIVEPLDSVRLGKNVAWNKTGDAIVANVTGHVLFKHGEISASETLNLAVDLDAGMPIDFPGEVVISGNVLDQAKLSARGNITIHGAIEAADVSLTGDLTVQRGICGKSKGRVSAGGFVDARFISNANVTAGGDVRVQNEIGNSHVTCKGKFEADGASLLSSHITAGAGISCHSAGSSAGFKTILELGIDPKELAEAHKIVTQLADQRAKAQEIRSKVEPLLKNQRSLTPQQKEKATELLYLADEADAGASKVAQSLNPLRDRLGALQSAEIRIAGTLYANVILRCLGHEAMTTAALKGPIRITLKLRAEGALFVIAGADGRPMSTIPAIATDATARQMQLLKS